MKKFLLVSSGILLTIILAEFFTTLAPLLGMLLHIGLLVFLLGFGTLGRSGFFSPLSGVFKGVDVEMFSNLLLASSIGPLIRIFTLALPLVFFPRIAWYSVAAFPLFSATAFLAYQQELRAEDLGFTINNLPLQIGVIFTGVLFGAVEYFILKPEPFIGVYSLEKIVVTILVLIFATGFVEEITFRGVILSAAKTPLGKWGGLIFVSILFSALHIGNSPLDALYVFPIALFFGIVVLKTNKFFLKIQVYR